MVGLQISATALAANQKRDFPSWISYLKSEAIKKGHQPQTIKDVFAVVNTKIPNAEIIRLDNFQPEYLQNFYQYYNKRVTRDFMLQGRKHYQKRKKFFTKLEKKYNVPGHYIIALWGSESSYGKVKGSHNILDATATLSWGRRQDFFTQQFFTAIKIVEKYNRSPDKMLGSWASAMGHMQFIPTTLLDYGVDGDGDKKVDIWDNEKDAFTSAAHYLYRRGWKANKLWGRAVIVKKGFNYNLVGIDKPKTLAYWHKKGVRRLNGSRLPIVKIKGALVAPAGAKGPKFLVYNNFHRLLNWNYSINNALTVALLADTISGKPIQKIKNQGETALKIEFVQQAQYYLQKLGYRLGEADGVFGKRSRLALKKYQKKNNLPADGYLNIDIFEKLQQDAVK